MGINCSYRIEKCGKSATSATKQSVTNEGRPSTLRLRWQPPKETASIASKYTWMKQFRQNSCVSQNQKQNLADFSLVYKTKSAKESLRPTELGSLSPTRYRRTTAQAFTVFTLTWRLADVPSGSCLWLLCRGCGGVEGFNPLSRKSQPKWSQMISRFQLTSCIKTSEPTGNTHLKPSETVGLWKPQLLLMLTQFHLLKLDAMSRLRSMRRGLAPLGNGAKFNGLLELVLLTFDRLSACKRFVGTFWNVLFSTWLTSHYLRPPG